MKYASWEQRILRENDLSARIIAFLATARTAARIEGRVAFAMPDLDDMTKRYAGCRAGMALLHQWERQRHHDSARYVAISPPRLIIDDAWLADREQAPIPHVELWMARTADGLPPLGDEPATLNPRIIEGLRLREIDGAIVRPPNPYRLGQEVRMAGGPFDGLVAKIIALDERDRVVVLLDLLSRSVKAHVTVEQLRAC